jgi:hypothetical protein
VIKHAWVISIEGRQVVGPGFLMCLRLERRGGVEWSKSGGSPAESDGISNWGDADSGGRYA